MKCPECCTELVVKDFPNLRVELDVCDSCNGLWFDPSELLKSIVKINDKTFEPPAVFLRESENHSHKDRPGRPCPCCSKSMKTISKNSIEIDFCKSCQGFWFDEGEVLALIRQFSTRYPSNKKSSKSLPKELRSIERLFKSRKEPSISVIKSSKNKKTTKVTKGEYVPTSMNREDIDLSEIILNIDDLADIFCAVGEVGLKTGKFIADLLIEAISS